MTYPEQVIADGATHYWRLNDAAGTVAADSVGGVSGTLSGGVTLAQPGALASGDLAMSFSGSGEILTAASVPIPLVCTIEGWITYANPSGHKPMVATYGVPGTTGDPVWLGVYGQAPYFNSTAAVFGTGGSVSMGTWHYLVAVLDGTSVAFYVDGVFNTSAAQARATPSAGPAMLGHVPGIAFLAGSLDEVAIYPRALTPAEIANHYTLAQSTAPEPTIGESRANSSDVDAALESLIAGDAQLMALLPDGVWWGVSPANKKQFVILSQVEHNDSYVMTNRAHEERFVYLVKAVTAGKSGSTAEQAEARIHLLLQDATLTPVGYHPSALVERVYRLRPDAQIHETTDTRWHHRGGYYQVFITPST